MASLFRQEWQFYCISWFPFNKSSTLWSFNCGRASYVAMTTLAWTSYLTEDVNENESNWNEYLHPNIHREDQYNIHELYHHQNSMENRVKDVSHVKNAMDWKKIDNTIFTNEQILLDLIG